MSEEPSKQASGLTGAIRREAAAYQGGEDRPMAGLAGAMAAYGAAVALGAGAVWRWGRVPDRLSAGDLVLLSVASHKLSRLLSKDPVTSPLRAPFTRFKGTSGESELAEEVRGSGARHAVGELVTCPFCLGQWVATAFFFGMALQPRLTRFAAGIFTCVAASDFLQLAYAAAEQRV